MMVKQKHKGGITFRESHGKLVKSTFPRCLRTYISVNDAHVVQRDLLQLFQEYPLPTPLGSWSHLQLSLAWHRIPKISNRTFQSSNRHKGTSPNESRRGTYEGMVLPPLLALFSKTGSTYPRHGKQARFSVCEFR
jgi:hypothetical protein